MKKRRLSQVLTQLATIFEMPLAHYFKDTSQRGIVVEQKFEATVANLNNAQTKASGLAGEATA